MHFDSGTTKISLEVGSKPFLFINKVILITNSDNWVERLMPAFLKITFTRMTSTAQGSMQGENLTLGGLITPYHRQPVIEVNRLFTVDEYKLDNLGSWRIDIVLNNLELFNSERLEIFTSNSADLNDIDAVVGEIERLKIRFSEMSSSTQNLLRIIPHFRLDWSHEDEFSDAYNIGASKPVIFSGLANPQHKIRKDTSLLQNSKIAQLLVDSFLMQKQISVAGIKDIHELIIKNGGRFRTTDIVIKEDNDILHPAFSEVGEIQNHIESLVNWYNDQLQRRELHPLVLSAVMHHGLVQIHPFADGNGSLARVISSLILLSYNIPPPISGLQDRVEYLTALRNADARDIRPLILFMGKRVIYSMTQALLNKHNPHG